MSLTDEQIIQILIDYVKDSRYKQAVLIDGEWGSGKTFFVEEKLQSRLNEELSENSIFYISLYGLDNFAQIMDEIYSIAFEDYFDKKLGDGKGEKLGKGLKFTSKILSVGLKHFNIDSKDLPSLSDIKQIKDTIIIFDDLERCNIDVNQLLGFINNLVEHNNIKVILIANQTEIGRIGISKDLPQKYSVVLDSRILLDEVKNDTKYNQSENLFNEVKNDTKYNQSEEKENISKEKLIYRTKKLFSDDISYKERKEKLIGLTIYYQADFVAIYEDIVEKYVEDEQTKEQLNNYKQVVLEIFEKNQHHNIRTLIFALMAYERFFVILDTIDFEPKKYLNEQKEKVLEYTIELSIQIKQGKSEYSWESTEDQTGNIYWREGNFVKSIFAYKFVDTYLVHHYWDSDEIKKIIKSIMEEEKEKDDHLITEKSLGYNKLYSWWELEDEEIIQVLSQIKDELATRKYNPRYFKDMIVRFIQIKYAEFDEMKYDEHISLMKSNLEEYTDTFEKRYLEILSSDSEFLNKYNDLVKPLFNVIDRKEKESKEKLNCFLNDVKEWDDEFVSKCRDNRSTYIMDKKFFFYMDIDNVIKKLKTSHVKGIYFFINGINEVYSFSNLEEFFKADISNIQNLIDKMDIEELSKSKRTRKKALIALQEKLQQSLKLIKR
ncbi:P-loop NTPase fold protein [Clostridium sp. UBA3061]|uniref:P-loop NTPase fold protein n=1 Tax=Clostridium sp. UBA3061 TaxID=1946353 RepID=UPI003216C861